MKNHINGYSRPALDRESQFYHTSNHIFSLPYASNSVLLSLESVTCHAYVRRSQEKCQGFLFHLETKSNIINISTG